MLMSIFSSCKIETPSQHESKLNEQNSDIIIVDESSQNEATSEKGQVTQPSSAQSNSQKPSDNKSPDVNKTTSGTAPSAQNKPNVPNTDVPKTTSAVTTTAPQKDTITINVSIDCKKAVGHSQLKDGIVLPKDGVIISKTTLEVKKGATVFDITKSLCSKKNVKLVYGSDGYIKTIGPISEHDCAGTSGWIYFVNASMPSRPANKYILRDGDTVRWEYTV